MTDTAYTDYEYDPDARDPEDSGVWLNLLEDAEKKFRDYQDKADKIDKVYANLNRQAGRTRDREFALFWSNIQVILPSIYARTPVPVAVPKFGDDRPDLSVTSEFLERALISAFDLGNINDTMLLVRDDLAIVGRGVAWVRYDTRNGEKVCFEHIDRKDFLHDPARNWCEVNWVARRAWMSFEEMKERFEPTSGDAYKQAVFEVRKNTLNDSGNDPRQRVGVWEIWHKGHNRVVWVTEGVPVVLDISEPHLKLEGFFPCPQPVYSTVERGSLVPVPDVLYYEDQLQEIDKLTARIHALADAIQVKGFYAAGGEIGEAIEAALSKSDDRQVMIPVSNFAALGGGSGPPVIWMPIEIIAQTIQGLIAMRHQLIDDVYQIIGLADIVRGATEAEETLGAQQIKRESTATRVRGKVNELVRFARDLAAIAGEIMAEEFDQKTLVEMSQMDLPAKKDVTRDIKEIEKAAEEAAQQLQRSIMEQFPPEALAQNPEAAQQAEQAFMQGQQQIIEQFQPRLEELRNIVSIDAVMEILRDQKLRPFMLDIETDSTVFPDEQVEKQSRMEFMAVLGQTINQFAPLLQTSPAFGPVFGEIVKFAMAPYRVGRQIESTINKAIEQAVSSAQAQGEDPNEEVQRGLVEAQMQLAQAELQKAQAQTMKVEADAQGKMQEIQLKAAEAQAKAQADQQRFQLELQNTQGKIAETEARIEKIMAEIQKMRVDAQVDMARVGIDEQKEQRETVKTVADIASREADRVVRATQPPVPPQNLPQPPRGRR